MAMLVHYDDTVSLGTIVATLSFILMGLGIIGRIAGGYARIETRMGNIETKLNVVFDWWSHQVDEATSLKARMFHGEIRVEKERE